MNTDILRKQGSVHTVSLQSATTEHVRHKPDSIFEHLELLKKSDRSMLSERRLSARSVESHKKLHQAAVGWTLSRPHLWSI
jgi:hypothetical protein